MFGRGDSFVQKITGSPTVDRPLQRIREFRNRPSPGIVVTVDMLSTGVDIPALEFIVFLPSGQEPHPVGANARPRHSPMPGHPDKSHFTVFDCFDGTLLEYFRKVSAFTIEPPEKPSRTVQEIIDAIWQNRDRPYNVRCLVKRLQRIDKEMSGEARDRFANFIPDGDVARFARELQGKINNDFTATLTLLRKPAFQDLLVNYPRPKRTFVVAYPTEDTVTSELLVRESGREYKPVDYLAAFARFVQENPLPIEAIKILLDRPQDWSTDALSELRQKLAATPERFTQENLEKAHAARYHKNLVDIISMVKHAAKNEEPLLTAPERVERAFTKIAVGRQFTDEQKKWLDRIRAHLIVSLSIDRGDFENVPVLLDAGGWKPADRVFDGRLEKLIEDLNEAMAA